MTALVIILTSLYLLAPMATALAVAKNSSICAIAGVVATVAVSVAFWVTFGSALITEKNIEIGALAVLWLFFGSVGSIVMVAEDSDIL